MRLVEMAGGDIGGLVFNPIASGRATLSKSQKELGIAVVDIGCGTTSLAVYEEGKLLALQIFPVGGGSITNDIAVGLKTGASVYDLPDCPFADWYDDGVTPKGAATRAVKLAEED
mgnify:CR=1 FL=1